MSTPTKMQLGIFVPNLRPQTAIHLADHWKARQIGSPDFTFRKVIFSFKLRAKIMTWCHGSMVSETQTNPLVWAPIVKPSDSTFSLLTMKPKKVHLPIIWSECMDQSLDQSSIYVAPAWCRSDLGPARPVAPKRNHPKFQIAMRTGL